MNSYQININRKNSFYGSALKYSVEIDGVYVGVLKNGGSLSFQTTAGLHTITFFKGKKSEQSITVSIKENDFVTNVFVKIDMSQHLEFSIESSKETALNNIRKQKKKSVVPAIIAIVVVFAALIAVVAFSGRNDSSIGTDEWEEMTDSEKAATLQANAEEKFQKGDYMGAIELCNEISEQYPETETAAGINDFLNEQYATFKQFTAQELQNEYDSNVVNADKEYTDQVIVVTGTVSSIDKTNGDSNLGVLLESGTYFHGVQLNFEKDQTDAVADLKEGDQIKAIGKCTGKSGKFLMVIDGENVMVEDCYIIK